MKYTIELTKKQMLMIETATEEYFRLRMGQDWEFCDDIAGLNHDLDPTNPNFERNFDNFIKRRDHLRELMQAFYRIAFEPEGYLKAKSEEMLIAEDIWEAVRIALGRSRWDSPLHVGSEPFPKVVKHEEVQ